MTTGAEAIGQAFDAEGVECVFGIPGATEVPFMQFLEGRPAIRYILCLHELVAVGMAEGYARASGKPGVLSLHTGTGLAAGLSLLSNAREGHVPLVVTVGQQDTRLLAEEPAMSDDLVAIARPFTKWAVEVRRAADLQTVLRRAFETALRPPAGPVMVSIPHDLLAEEAGPADYEPGRRFTRTRADARAVEAAADLLAAAPDPAMIVGDGVSRCDALDEAVELAELLGARVYHHWMADVDFPVRHPLYLGDFDTDSTTTRALLARAGALVVVGAPLFQQAIATQGPLCPPDVPIVQIDDDPWQIGKNLPVACGLQGDIRSSLIELDRALAQRLENGDCALERRAKIAAEKQAQTESFERRVAARWDDEPIAAERLAAELSRQLPPGATIVDDSWSYSAIFRSSLPLAAPLEYLRSRRGGAIGGGLPTALGIKLADPGRPVVCVTGDGSAMWSVQSLWNSVHDALPITVIVLSNGCYRQVRSMRARMLAEPAGPGTLGTDICSPQVDFSALAAGMGLASRRVTRPEDLEDALRVALSSGVAYLLDVVVDASL